MTLLETLALLTLIITFAQAHWGQGQWVFVLSAAVGLLVCYAFGTAWFPIVYTRTGAITLGVVLAKCVLPFLLPDAVNITLQVLQYIDGKHDKRDRPPSLANSRSQSLLILMIGYGS